MAPPPRCRGSTSATTLSGLLAALRGVSGAALRHAVGLRHRDLKNGEEGEEDVNEMWRSSTPLGEGVQIDRHAKTKQDQPCVRRISIPIQKARKSRVDKQDGVDLSGSAEAMDALSSHHEN